MENIREKLIALLDEATGKLKELCGGHNDGTGNTVRADHLIANGVTVLPCKIGDDIWWIDAEKWSVECEKNGVTGFVVKKNEILIRDTAYEEFRIGSQYCYLSKEDAEKALATMKSDCNYDSDGICVNADCPMCCEYCPVPDTPGVCRHEKRGADNG